MRDRKTRSRTTPSGRRGQESRRRWRRLGSTLGTVVLAAAAVATPLVPSHAAPGAGARIEAIRVSESDGDTALVIAASQRLTFTTWKLDRPARVVIDVSGARLGNVEVPFDAGTQAVGSVNASVTETDGGARTRVVLTLRQLADYRVETKGNEIVVRVVPQVKAAPATPPPVASASASAAAQSEVRKLAEERARNEESRRQAEAAKQAADAATRRLAEERAKAAEAQKAAEAAARTTDGERARKVAEEKVELEARRAQAVEAQRQAEEARRAAESAQKSAQGERARADAALRAAEASQAKAEERVRTASEADAARVKQQLEAARRETERARVAATTAAGEMERVRKEKQALEAARAEMERQRQTLARSEGDLKKSQRETEEARKRAVAAEKQAEAARLREEERGNAVRVAAAQVDLRRHAVESKLVDHEQQKQRLQQAERLVTEREAKLQAAAAELAARQKAVADAEARGAALEKTGASEEARARAARETSEAQAQRREATAATERARQELGEAVGARKQEETRRRQLEGARVAEEKRLADAVAARAAEEARRQTAEEARRKEEARLVELQAAVKSLKAAGGLRDQASGLSTDRKAAPAVAKAPPAAADLPRPRSVTLRVPSKVQRIDFVDEPTRSSVIIDLDEPSMFAVERVGGQRLSLRLLHVELPRGLERSLDATEYLGPVRVISTYRDPDSQRAVRVDVDLAEDVPNKIRQDGSRLYWDFQKPGARPGSRLGHVEAPAVRFVATAPRARAHSLDLRTTVHGARQVATYRNFPLAALQMQQAQSLGPGPGPAAPAGPNYRPGGTTKKRYVGRRVDLDFKSADIHNILRLLSDVGQVNIVTSDDVKGEVTIKMRDVPWDQALDVVLRGKQLGSVREGNLIRVAPLTVLEKELEQEIARQKQITDVLPTETRLIGVSYADAKVLQDRAKDLLSQRGKISVDDRTNNLIVSDVSKNLALIEELVRNLDTQTSQVVIEARIVEARSTFVRQIGVQWGGTGFADADHGNPTGLVFPYNIGVGGGASGGDAPLGGLVPAPRSGLPARDPNFAVNLPVAAGTGAGGALGLTLGSVAGAFNLNLRLSALESTGQVRILSSPRITTMDNIEASIEQGVSIPISVVSSQGVSTVFVDAILKLSVRPHVTNEGTVMLNVQIQRNEPDFGNTGARGDPTILKKEARTQMLVRDGDTAVIGGIYQRNSGLSYAKVPFFADVPILGALFRNRRENDDRTEFLVFITPRIANRARALGQ